MSFHVKTVVVYTLKKENLGVFFNLLPFWSKWQQSISEAGFAGQNLSCSPAELWRFNPAKELWKLKASFGRCFLHPRVLQVEGILPAWPLLQINSSSSWISSTGRFGWFLLPPTVALCSKLRLMQRESSQMVSLTHSQPEFQNQGCSGWFPLELLGTNPGIEPPAHDLLSLDYLDVSWLWFSITASIFAGGYLG